MARTVAGLVPFTSIDFPGCLAAVIFFQGCPLRCPFCHNPNLQPLTDSVQTWEETLAFLKTRKKRLDGVVMSGGEPLMQPNVFDMLQQIKDLGFKVAIHTSGVYPEKLEKILPLLDWVGLDIKGPWDKYDTLSGRKNMVQKVQKSLKILIESGIDFECRTTCDPNHLIPADTLKIAHDLQKLGVKIYALQKYNTFPEDKNPPSVLAIESFFTNEALKPIRKLYPHLIIR